MAKRKCVFRKDLTETYSYIIHSTKGSTFAHCTICNVDINISFGGISSVKHHIDSSKHSASKLLFDSSKPLGAYFREKYSPVSLKIAAAEGTCAFHTIKHHHSFKSMDCTSHLLSVCFPDSEIAKNFHSARTKTKAIITGVLAPASVEDILIELKAGTIFSLSTDASNHAELKTFPIIVRYFNNKGVQNKLLDFVNQDSEKSKDVADMILNIVSENELNMENMIAFCADNAPVNFGGVNRCQGENVFTKLKQYNSKLIPLGCPSHLVHKSAQIASDRALSVDVESVALKIAWYFSGESSGVINRYKGLVEFCDFIDIHYMKFPTHGKTRWLTLHPLIERILMLWEAIKSYFLSNELVPRMLETFFNANLSQCYFLFLHSTLKLFNDTNMILQRSNLCLPEMIRVMNKLKLNLMNRSKSGFLGSTTEAELEKIDNAHEINKFKLECSEFYKISIDYLNKWLHLDQLPQNLDWLLLEDAKLIEYETLKESAKSLCPEIVLDDDLFEEVCNLKRLFPDLSSELVGTLAIDEVWAVMTKCNFPCIRKLVSAIFAIPASNASCERVFSLSKVQWTDDRNKLEINTVGSILKVLVNFDMTCKEMYSKLINDEVVLRKICSKEKYY